MNNLLIKYNTLKVEYRKVEESNLSIANGYLGMRGSFEEGWTKDISGVEGTYINAFYDYFDITYAAKYTGYPDLYQRMVPLVNMQNVEFWINDMPYLFDPKKITNYELVLDMSSGEVSRKYRYNINNDEHIDFVFKKVLNQKYFESFNQKIELNVNFKKAVNFKILFPIIFKEKIVDKGIPNDPRAGKEGEKAFIEIDKKINKSTASIVYQTLRSEKQFAYGTQIKGLESFSIVNNQQGLMFEKDITQEKIIIDKTSVMYENQLFDTTTKVVQEKIDFHSLLSYDEKLNEIKKYFVSFWQKAYSEFGANNSELEAPNNFNMFQLYTNVGRLPWTNMAAKGLTGEGYAGHYFWDSEIYITTALTLFDAKLAKQMLMFRHKTLPQAKQRAKIMAHPNGALYPWRTINGEETSTYFPAGTAQYHIDGDISFTIVNYFKATKDYDFLFNYGLDILVETSRLWMDKIVVDNGVAHINSVTGPDEYQILVNDDYWTNCVAENNLKWAHKTLELLEQHDSNLYNLKVKQLKVNNNEITTWLETSKQFIFENDKLLNVTPQHDNFLKRKPVDKAYIENHKPFLRKLHPLSINTLRVTKQADVVLADLFFYNKNNTEVMKKNWEFYDQTDTADSSLSKCVYAIMASRLKINDYGFEYFKDSINLDLYDTHKNTDRGLHMANMGGTRMFAIYGLLGINIELEYLELDPRYNEILNEYSITVEYQNALLSFKVKNKKLFIKNINNISINIKFKNEIIKLDKEIELSI